MKTITVAELHALSLSQEIELIDVRTPEEYRDVHATLARSVPMDTLVPQELFEARQLASDEPLYFICHLGGRSGRVCNAMTAAGYANVVNVEGGTTAWVEAGLPVASGQAASNAA